MNEIEARGYYKGMENVFGFHNLNPIQIKTYEDVARELFMRKRIFCIAQDKGNEIESALHSAAEDWYHYPMNCTSQKQAEKLLAINKLLNVAKFLNKDWNPDWENGDEEKFYIGIDNSLKDKQILIKKGWWNQYENIYFRTEELAKQAVQILGEDVVRLTLSTDY